MKIEYVYEYRINKKGCECFRSRSHQDAKERLESLRAAHPNTDYQIQSRYSRHNVYTYDTDYKGRVQWSPWN